MEFVVGGLVVALVVALAVLAAREARSRKAASLVRRTVVVNTRDGSALKGVLLADDPARVTLTQAFYVTAQGETDVQGLVHVDKAQITFIQEPGGRP